MRARPPASIALASLAALWLGAALPALAQAPAATGQAPMQREETEADPDQLLDENALANPEAVKRAAGRADEQPPQTSDPDTLAHFYWRRSKAADFVGHRQQALQDIRKASGYARQAKGPDLGPVLFQQAQIEASHSSVLRAIKLVEEAIRETPSNFRARLIIYSSTLAMFNARAGHVEAADRALATAEETFSKTRGFRNAPNPELARRNSTLTITGARAAVLETHGRYAEAEKFRRSTIAELATNQQPQDEGKSVGAHNLLARNLEQQGRLEDAETEARTALAAAQRKFGVGAYPTANSLALLSHILADEGRGADAEPLARKTIEMLQAMGLNGRGTVRIVLGDILASQGRWAEALEQYDSYRQFVSKFDPEGFEAAAGRDPSYPLTLIKAGHAAEARERLTRMVSERRQAMGDAHYSTAETRGLFAMALAATGDPEGAMKEFAAAVPILIDRSRQADDDSAVLPAADQRVRLIIEAYIDLLVGGPGGPVKRGDLDPVAEAFRLADAARGRVVARALAASAARAATQSPDLAGLVRTAQDTEKQIGALNGLLANAISAKGEERDEDGIKSLGAQIASLRQERQKATSEIERRFPDYARLVDPKPATIEGTRAALRSGESLIAFYIGEQKSYVWAVPAKGQVAFVAAPLGRAALTATVQHLREALEPPDAAVQIPAFRVAEAYKLYATLLQPVESGWRDASSLIAVPHAALAELPLSLLPTAPVTLPAHAAGQPDFIEYRNVPWLIRKVAVTQLPSSGALATLRAVPAGGSQRRAFVGFGDPRFAPDAATAKQPTSAPAATRGVRGSPALASLTVRSVVRSSDYSANLADLPRLPDTAEEVRSIAATLGADPKQDVFLGPAASEATLKTLDLARYRVVMFATHGLVPGDLNGLTQPALALSAPQVAGGAGTGLLTVEKILSLKLDADWVVLSACNTAAGEDAGAEAVSGLGRAFFYAGTRAVLVSNWPVETHAARALTTDLFRRQAEKPDLARAEALRQAMLAVIDGPGLTDKSGKTVVSFAHPLFWAPFSLVGDGGAPR
jgi:CHAT domain-containing protein